jgi:hypothetical protein
MVCSEKSPISKFVHTDSCCSNWCSIINYRKGNQQSTNYTRQALKIFREQPKSRMQPHKADQTSFSPSCGKTSKNLGYIAILANFSQVL